MKKFFTSVCSFFLFFSCGHHLQDLKGKTKAPFDGKKFSNLWPFKQKSIGQLLKWKLTETPAQWPRWVESPQLEQVDVPQAHQISYTYINHSTFLIQIGDFNILTDPVYSERVSPVSWAGPKRVRVPGIEFDKLPTIHLVLISHDHYDHLDYESIKLLKHFGVS